MCATELPETALWECPWIPTLWIGSWANPKEELEPQQSTWNGEEHDTPTCWSHGWYAAMIIVAQIQVKNLSYCLAKKSEKNEKHFRQDSGLFSARKLAHLPLSPNTEPAAAPPSALFQKSSLPRIEAATDSVKAKMPPMAANVKP